MTAYTKIGGEWKEFDPNVKVNGSWHPVNAIHNRVGGVWEKVFQSRFIVVPWASNIAPYSTDGATWTNSILPVSSTWVDVLYGNGTYVASTNDSRAYATSTTGTSWVARTLPTTPYYNNGMSFGGGNFLFNNYNYNFVYYSTNGITWTFSTLPSVTYPRWRTSRYGNGRFVLLGREGDTMMTTDLVSWTRSTAQFTNVRSSTYGNGKFVATGYTNLSLSSTDGVSWTTGTLPITADWFGVSFVNNSYIAIAANQRQAAISTNGTYWTSTTLPISAGWRTMTSGLGKAIGVGFSPGCTVQTTDGYSWTIKTLPSQGPYYDSIAFGHV